MKGKLAVIVLILAPILVGGGIWYAQEYGYYTRIEPESDAAIVQIQSRDGTVEFRPPDFQGIDADSSPLRWRACFRMGNLPHDRQSVTPVPYENATPLIGPNWFDCFDAVQIGTDLAAGKAQAYLGKADIHPDVDRVLAIYPDGRAYGWHQYNDKTPERGVMD